MKRSSKLIAGVDEAGRGPLAGPVLAAAVILDPKKPINGLMDSKKLSARQRERLFIEIREKAMAISVAQASVLEIDKMNILRASLLAMQRAIETLTVAPDAVLVDGPYAPKIFYPVRAIIRGDELEPAISAASIIAKVLRDRLMRLFAARFPEYGFDKHKGYGTKGHIKALEQLGPTILHRRTFSPVKEMLCV